MTDHTRSQKALEHAKLQEVVAALDNPLSQEALEEAEGDDGARENRLREEPAKPDDGK